MNVGFPFCATVTTGSGNDIDQVNVIVYQATVKVVAFKLPTATSFSGNDSYIRIFRVTGYK